MAKKLNITKSGTSKIIDRLENKSYVFREPSPVDGRVCYIRITDKGVNEVSKIIKRYTDYVSEMLKDLDPIVLDHIKKVLELLVILEARRVRS
jgi:DNA-binding MarR family transcriptional regulator